MVDIPDPQYNVLLRNLNADIVADKQVYRDMPFRAHSDGSIHFLGQNQTSTSLQKIASCGIPLHHLAVKHASDNSSVILAPVVAEARRNEAALRNGLNSGEAITFLQESNSSVNSGKAESRYTSNGHLDSRPSQGGGASRDHSLYRTPSKTASGISRVNGTGNSGTAFSTGFSASATNLSTSSFSKSVSSMSASHSRSVSHSRSELRSAQSGPRVMDGQPGTRGASYTRLDR